MPETPVKLAKDGTRRGGARPGAGRKRKGLDQPTSLSELEVRALLAEPAPEEIDALAQRHASLGIETLSRLLLYGTSETAKIKAAKEVLDRGYGKPAVEIGGDAAMPGLPLMMPPGATVATPSVSAEVRSQARKLARVAVEVLRKIAQEGESETARASAVKALFDRGLGTVGKARMPDEQRDEPAVGKKEQQQRAASAAATGKFATPAPPRRVLETLQ